MAYVSVWEKLSEARSHVMANTGCSREEAEADICRAIAERAVRVQAKLGRQAPPGRMTSRDTFLKGEDFRIPTSLKSEDLDWQKSRPLKPWMVPREAFKQHGYWNLEWIEVFKTDVTNVLCSAPKEGKPAAKNAPGKLGARSRSRPSFERAQRAFKALYPDGAPTQADVSNKILCWRIAQWLSENGLVSVSDDSILRAVGRRN
jgi:hypothetical protein